MGQCVTGGWKEGCALVKDVCCGNTVALQKEEGTCI